MQVFKKITNNRSVIILNKMPSFLEFYPNNPGVLHFIDGNVCSVGCLECLNPRCIHFSEEEIVCPNVNTFVYDKTLDVCPLGAIRLNESSTIPVIDSQKCLSCGICVSRCPVGALYFTNSGELKVHLEFTQYTKRQNADSAFKKIHALQINNLTEMPRMGILSHVSDHIFEVIYSKMSNMDSNIHNTIVRNLLIALGCNCSMRRIGDAYTRMDIVYSSKSGSFGVAEVEFGKETLDALRCILEDIAVLNTRYDVPKRNNQAIVICLNLPNARQGYWQVVKDINVVTGMRIGTLTIGALMILLWLGGEFCPDKGQYYIDYDDMNLRQILCRQMNCQHISISEGILGILEPMK